MQFPAEPATGFGIEADIPTPVVGSDRACIRCSYNLRGLPHTGNCPECGTPVEQSLRGILLRFSSDEYLAKIRNGLSLIVIGILLFFAALFAAFTILVWTGGGSASFEVAMSGLMLLPVGLTLFGYWNFTHPDPGFRGSETPDSARKVIRVAVVIHAASQVVSFAVDTLVATSALPPAAGRNPTALFDLLLSLVDVLAWIVQFFAMMRYSRWLARRIPDALLIRRTQTYMWLLPVLYTVGIVLIGMGPVIAMILYILLLLRLRQHITAILSKDVRAPLPDSR
jgi:hypothetical protein